MSTRVPSVAVRTVALVLLTVLASLLARLGESPDADIGLGLLVVALLALLLAHAAGRRARPRDAATAR